MVSAAGARRRIVLVIVACICLAATAYLIRQLVDRPAPVRLAPRDGDEAKWTAQLFIRKAIASNYVGACLEVVDNGTVLNPCMASLPKRPDLATITRLDPKTSVTAVHERDGGVVIGPDDLSPKPATSVTLRLDHGADGQWKVRELNGRPIAWRARPKG